MDQEIIPAQRSVSISIQEIDSNEYICITQDSLGSDPRLRIEIASEYFGLFIERLTALRNGDDL